MEEQEGLRLYSFGNMYLGGVQAGIQCQHATTELWVKYQHESQRVLMEWACNYKTTILLNGGMANNLEDLKSFLAGRSNPNGENKLPWAYFNESTEALGGCITNVCVVVPERIYSEDLHYKEYEYMNYVAVKMGENIPLHEYLSSFEFELFKRIKRCRLIS